MMSGYHKLKTACCAVVLTFGLAACGGGGSDQTAAPDPAPPPTAEAEEAARLLAAMAAGREHDPGEQPRDGDRVTPRQSAMECSLCQTQTHSTA